MLRDCNFKGVYKSDVDNILEDFYMPALSVATTYDRAVGYFSASTLNYAAQALSAFVKHDGRIRLVLGAFSEQGDLDAVKEGYRRREIIDRLGAELLRMLESVSDDLFQNRLETLAWLVAHGRLEVKIALRAEGMYHDKIGIIGDAAGNQIAFSGSANESARALLPTHNYESINVFPSWIPELHAAYYRPHAESFERLWNNNSPRTVVLEIPAAVKDRLLSVAQALTYTPDPEIEAAIVTRLNVYLSRPRETSSLPREPSVINGQPFQIRAHQIAALDAWKSKGDFQGVFDLATGAGKTITAIHAIVKLAERIDGLSCVIAVPYQNLADQWVEILAQFNIYPVKCYVSRAQWYEQLRTVVHELKVGSRRFACVVVVNRTLKTSEFQECLGHLPGGKLLWIGDECHHHTSKTYNGYLPESARYRIGLSATPKHYLDDDRNDRLNNYYGDLVYSYTLQQAIEDKVLTPYRYYPHVVELTSSESEEYVDLSEQIGKLIARQGLDEGSSTPQLTALLMRRSRIVGAARNKIRVLESVIGSSKPVLHTLFYCGDGMVEADDNDNDNDNDGSDSQRQVEVVSALLHDRGWNVSRFTSRETRAQRECILEDFRLGVIDAMVAIKCLDEGIDVPACSTAYILASSRDPRQFIQRRGRILRRSPGKETACIHDFIVVLPDEYLGHSEYAKRLIRSELSRVVEFASLSTNRTVSYETLSPILKKYDLEYFI